VVVIDVLRAFTTAAFAIEGGASQLHLAGSDEEALRLMTELGSGAIAIKDGELVDGFDLGNSPGQVMRADVRSRPVVMRTRNGTVGVHRAIEAPLVLCASLVNAAATARAISASNAREVFYVVTGDEGRAPEDLACATRIHRIVEGETPREDTVDQVKNSAAAADLSIGVARGYRGVAADDVALALDIDRFDFAMIAHRAGRSLRLSPLTADSMSANEGEPGLPRFE
jgi:2-phosphosulfolactate phosphatase